MRDAIEWSFQFKTIPGGESIGPDIEVMVWPKWNSEWEYFDLDALEHTGITYWGRPDDGAAYEIALWDFVEDALAKDDELISSAWRQYSENLFEAA